MNPNAHGSWIAIAAAALFGFTTPLVKHFGVHAGPFATAMLLYVGAALGAGLPRRRVDEPGITRAQAPRLALVAFFGAAVAPAALAWGLQRSGALAGSLLLNLEALFTVLLAALIYREPIGRRVAVASFVMLAAGGLLALRTQGGGTSSVWGLAALVVATLAWGVDNTLMRPLSDFDPRAVVFWKATLGAALSAVVALILRDAWPEPLVWWRWALAVRRATDSAFASICVRNAPSVRLERALSSRWLPFWGPSWPSCSAIGAVPS